MNTEERFLIAHTYGKNKGRERNQRELKGRKDRERKEKKLLFLKTYCALGAGLFS